MRYYSSNAVTTSLTSGISNSATSIPVASVSGFPVSYPYTLSIDADNASKELVEVTAAAGTMLTVTRGVDGTAAVSHSLGAVVSHDHSARDFRETQEHMDATDGVHGVTGDVVGTTDVQTVTNKDLSSGTNTFPASLATDTEVQAVADDLVDHLADAAGAHAASAVSFSPAAGIAATTVQAAIVEDAGDLANHLADTVDAHDASAISFAPTGTIAATNVQTAVAEVATDAAAALSAALPSGTVLMGGWASAPSGTLWCDGSNVSRVTYASLFAAIGTRFGVGDGSTTFGLPNLVAKFPHGSLADGSDVGGTGGAATHTHPLSDDGAAKINANDANDAIYLDQITTGSWTADRVYTATGRSVDANATSFTVAAGLTGDTDLGSSLPPYVTFGFVIKT